MREHDLAGMKKFAKDRPLLAVAFSRRHASPTLNQPPGRPSMSLKAIAQGMHFTWSHTGSQAELINDGGSLPQQTPAN